MKTPNKVLGIFALFLILLSAPTVFWISTRVEKNGLVEDPSNPVPIDGFSTESSPKESSGIEHAKHPEPDTPLVIDAFENWVEAYVLADPDEKTLLLQEGISLARSRRQEMKHLIQTNPETALALAVSYEIRRALPSEIINLLETPISEFAEYELLVYCPETGQQGGGFDRQAIIDEMVYQVFTYGNRLEVTTKDKLSLHGIAIDEVLAVSNDPVRILSNAEKTDRSFNSGIVASVGGNVYSVSNEEALERLREMVDRDERSLGPRPKIEYRALSLGEEEGITVLYAEDQDFLENGLTEMQSEHTEGPKKMLYIRARFSNQDADYEPNDLETLRQRQAGCEAFWFENSYGKSTLTTVFTDTVSLPESANYYADQTSGRLNNLYNDVIPLVIAAGQAKGQDWDPANYDFFTLLTRGGSWGYAGVASVGGRRSHLTGAGSSNIRTASHEFGHNLGLRHANYWRTDSTSPIGRDSIPGGYVGDEEGDERIGYGHKFSVMSAQNGQGDFNEGRGHYTTGEKVHIDWLVSGDGDWVSVSESTPTPIRLYRHDVESEMFGQMTSGVPRAIKINRDSGDYAETNKRRYWLSYRRLPTNGISGEWLPYGLQVDWQRENYGNDGSILLDMTPYTRDAVTTLKRSNTDNRDKEDAVIVVGRTFSDTRADIHFTPIAQGGENPNEWIDVLVNVGTQRNNNRPDITSFTATAVEIGRNETVNFEVAATAPDGDILYYSWTFGDNAMVVESLNSTTASKSWDDEGIYPVRVTASDGKGGSDTKEILINVGPIFPANTISGRVIYAGLPVESARVVLREEEAEAEAWTDGDGIYVLPGITSRYPLLEVSKDDLSFEPQFLNPLFSLTEDVIGLDWVALQDGPGTGSLELAITPYVSVIPLGADLKMTAWVWDESGKHTTVLPQWSLSGGGAISEGGVFSGTEEGGPYIVTATQGSATAQAEVSVLDVVAVGIIALTPQLSESGNINGAFRIRRYGNSNDRLDVQFYWRGRGSATMGEDYVGINRSVIIPQGESFVDVPIQILDDAEVEGTEELTFVLGIDDRHSIYRVEASATIEILDDSDRAPSVSITSPTQALSVVPQGVGLLIETAVFDDGFPNPPGRSTLTWSVLQAPEGGMVVFSPPQGDSTVANFHVPGLYKLLVTADDGVNLGTAEISAFAGVVPGSGPSETDEIIYFSFDEGEGDIVTDSRGGDNNGALIGGANWANSEEAISGTAIVLDGIDDQLNIPDSPDLNLRDHSLRTIALWFKANNPLRNSKQVLYEEGGGTRGFNIYIENGQLYVGGWNNGANSWEETYLNTELSDTEWHHVALVLNAEVSIDLQPDTFKGFLDGLEFGSGEAATLDPHSGDIAIGAVRGYTQFHDGNSGQGGFRFSGLVDEFHLWNRALTPGEIALLFGGGYIGPTVEVSSVAHTYSSVVVPNGMGLVLSGSTPGNEALKTLWTEVISPEDGEVIFGNPEEANTVASFPKPGYYKLRFSADDGIQKSALDVNVHAGVDSGGNPGIENQAIHLKLDEGSGPTTSNSGYETELFSFENSAGWSSPDEGISGSAAKFIGGDGYIKIPNFSQIEKSGIHKSIAVWFKPNTQPTATKEVIFELGNVGTGINIYLEDNLLYFGAYDDWVRLPWITHRSVPIERGKWHHAVLVLEAPVTQQLFPDALQCYLNGVLVAVGPGASFPSSDRPGVGGVNFTTFFHDGTWVVDGGVSLAGLIDEFRYFHRYALSIDEIGMLYAFGNIGPMVEAGPDQLAVPTHTVALVGSATDDGRWTNPLTYQWGFVDRPGAGTFSAPNANGVDTQLDLLAGGTYRIFLGAFDGQVTTFDEITVNVDQPGYFDLWLDDFPSIIGEDRAPDANPDNDERINLAEYGFGGVPDEPDNAYEFRLKPEIVVEEGQMYTEFRFPRRFDRALGGLKYEFQISDNLAPDSWVSTDYSILELTPIDDTFEEVRLRINQPLNSSDSRLFGRIKIYLDE